jgi:carboxypeptidase Q
VVLETGRRISEMARAGQRPRRTVRIVLFANEEFGLSGAFAYAQAHAAELAKHVIAAESDLGSGKILKFQTRVKPNALPRIAEIAELLAPLGVEQGGNEGFGGADLIPLVAGGVPVFQLDPDATKYFDVHHTADDTLDKVDAKGLDHAVASFLTVTLAAAETDTAFGPIAAPGPRRR